MKVKKQWTLFLIFAFSQKYFMRQNIAFYISHVYEKLVKKRNKTKQKQLNNYSTESFAIIQKVIFILNDVQNIVKYAYF